MGARDRSLSFAEAVFSVLAPALTPQAVSSVSAHGVPVTLEEDLDAAIAVSGGGANSRMTAIVGASGLTKRNS